MIKKLFFIALAGVMIYSAYLTAIPYYHYFAFKSDLQELVKVSVADRKEEIMEKVLETVERYHIPVQKNAIKVFHEKYFIVQVSWTETIDYFTLYQKTIHFRVDTRE
jgi:hypothetical protein